MLLVLNEQPIKETHVSWFTTPNNYPLIDLHEVILQEYKHPEIPNHALVYVLKDIFIKTFQRTSQHGAQCVLLEAALKNINRT